jgi:NTE family protein
MAGSGDKKKRDGPFGIKHQHSVLVLQGGGALGAYQAGVYQGMAERGFAPDWIAGVSIGAINAALIAGNRPERRLERLRAFWERVSSGLPLVVPAQLDLVRLATARLNATAVVAFGVPGFFVPRIPPPLLAPEGSPEALSIYDNTPLRDTLEELVDFGFLSCKSGVRLSLGAVNVQTGNSVYFDSREQPLTVQHVMASGSLPPGFPSTLIDGSHYWDGGMVSNSPLWYVLDDAPHLSALIVQVDLFSARGRLPMNFDQVLERAKDIQYSSKTRFNTTRVAELEDFRQALSRGSWRRCRRSCATIPTSAGSARCAAAGAKSRSCTSSTAGRLTRPAPRTTNSRARPWSDSGKRASMTCACRVRTGTGRRRALLKTACGSSTSPPDASLRQAPSIGDTHEAQGQSRHRDRRGERSRTGDRPHLRARRRASGDRRSQCRGRRGRREGHPRERR